MTALKCSGTTYSGATRVVTQESNADFYEAASAVCDICKQRLELVSGRRIPDHWLTVTIHEVTVR